MKAQCVEKGVVDNFKIPIPQPQFVQREWLLNFLQESKKEQKNVFCKGNILFSQLLNNDIFLLNCAFRIKTVDFNPIKDVQILQTSAEFQL